MKTELGRRFAKAMVKPEVGKKIWAASPNELHSELMATRGSLVDELVKKGISYEDAIKTLQNPTDKIASKLIKKGGLNRFINNSTPKKEVIDLIKMLPALSGLSIGGLTFKDK